MSTFVRSIVLCCLLAYSVSAQTIPNAGFETWSGGDPTEWFTTNVPGFAMPVTQSSSFHGGSSAAAGTVVTVFGGIVISPMIFAGVDGAGFPINSRPEALHGWYKYSSDSSDRFSVTIGIMKSGTTVGAGAYYSSNPHSVYTEFVANVNYTSGDTPDTAFILIAVVDSPSVHLGSTFTVDDLSFGAAVVGVSETGNGTPYSFALDQNYPNPFNPTTRIQFQIAKEEFVTLKVYNQLGQEVATLVNEMLGVGRYRAVFDAAKLPSGVYFYKLTAGTFLEMKKMLLLK